MKRLEMSHKSNPNAFCKYVKNNRFLNTIPNEIYLNNIFSTNELTTADLLSAYFSSVYSTEQIYLEKNEMGISTFDLPIMLLFLWTISLTIV